MTYRSRKPAVLVLAGGGPAAVDEDLATRALLEGRARGLWTHVVDQPRTLASAVVLRELADVCSVVDVADRLEWAGDKQFEVLFDIGGRTELAAAEIARTVGAPGNSPESVATALDRVACRQALATAGFRQPRLRLCADAADAAEFLGATTGPWVAKGRAADDGVPVTLVTGPEELPEQWPALVEEFVQGKEFSVEGVFLDGTARVLAVAEKEFAHSLMFREIGHVLPAELAETEGAEIDRVVAAALAELGLTYGPFHVELWLTEQGVVLGSVRPRPGGDWIHVLLAHAIPGLELCGLVYDNALRLAEAPESLAPTRAAAVRFLVAPPGRLVKIDHWREVLDHPAVLRAELSVEPGAVIEDGRANRVGMVVVGASTPAAASTLAGFLADSVRFVVEPHLEHLSH